MSFQHIDEDRECYCARNRLTFHMWVSCARGFSPIENVEDSENHFHFFHYKSQASQPCYRRMYIKHNVLYDILYCCSYSIFREVPLKICATCYIWFITYHGTWHVQTCFSDGSVPLCDKVTTVWGFCVYKQVISVVTESPVHSIIPHYIHYLHHPCLVSFQFMPSIFTGFFAEMATEWTEESVYLCLQLFVSLLPLNHKLLKELSYYNIS